MTKRSKPKLRSVESYAHTCEDRANNPPVGLVTPDTDPDTTGKEYWHDPHIDPELSWAGKKQHASFEVPTVSLHVHERIDPRTIIETVRKKDVLQFQPSLFDSLEENPPIRQAIEFYKHRHNWTNRLIAGDSLLVMNSLLEKEALGGKVQTVYFDPPYGIKYGSNFQPFVNRKSVTDGKDTDLTAEPEQIRAFRDTWELGIHSYLNYLKDRLLLVRELLSESGSCFVQIGDENVHRVSIIMDEIFGAENRMATITFATTSGSSAKGLPEVADYLLHYSKDRKQSKYRQLYEELSRQEIVETFDRHVMVEEPDGSCRKLTDLERFDPDRHLPKGSRIYQRTGLDSQGVSVTGRSEPYIYDGRVFNCSKNRHWSVSSEAMDRLADMGRLEALSGPTSLRWKKYEDEYPGRRINNIWHRQMYPSDKRYVVETSVKAVMRCILMTSDPGDLVFDPTCGSGTTAFAAEQYGRRWITCDTSRVAVSLAKQRLMTAKFDYYELNRPDEGVGSGFKYKRIPKVSPSTLSGAASESDILLYDQPLQDRNKSRVTGPFTVEAVPAPTVKPIADFKVSDPMPADNSVNRMGETVRQAEWRDELFRTGIRGKQGQRLTFSRLESCPGTRWLHADGEIDLGSSGSLSELERVVVSFGPEHAPLEQKQVEHAVSEAQSLAPKPKIIIFAGFQFDPEAAKDIEEMNWPGVTLLRAQMNADLFTEDLKKKRSSNESFWLIGQPDIALEKVAVVQDKPTYQVSVRGFDYYNIQSGNVESGDEKRIAIWMLDPDYDGRSLFPRQVFFPMAGNGDGWAELAKNLKAEIDHELIKEYRGTVSLPFEAGEHEQVAVKIVDDRGVESLKILHLT